MVRPLILSSHSQRPALYRWSINIHEPRLPSFVDTAASRPFSLPLPLLVTLLALITSHHPHQRPHCLSAHTIVPTLSATNTILSYPDLFSISITVHLEKLQALLLSHSLHASPLALSPSSLIALLLSADPYPLLIGKVRSTWGYYITLSSIVLVHKRP